jgi:glycogen operon protein
MSSPPLGATLDPAGAAFALYSAHAVAVELCLFDGPDAVAPREVIRLEEKTGDVWHRHVPGVKAGQLYGYRVDGHWDPSSGYRFNPAKVLIDPYARAVGRPPLWHPSLLAYAEGSDGDGTPDTSDSAPYAPLGAVIESDFDWGDDRPPRTPWAESIIYEAHVKGLTIQHPFVEHKGTYLGLASPFVIDHLKELGVTAIELLPIHAHAAEPVLIKRGLSNYWGYNTLNFFSPDPRYAVGDPRHAPVEFKTMVRVLHEAGLEVILDVVFNHTAETGHLGPHLSFRGIDNQTYYRLEPRRRSHYEDFTGCGNTLDMRNAPVRELMMDSLRYWVREMHVDGFRFDLAPALARGDENVEGLADFFGAVQADPVLAPVKLIAEPWDAAPGGYHVGGFPAGWSEWNGQYRDTVRRFWRGDRGMLPDLATRLAGSSDVFNSPGRTPRSSINFVTSHDGFTLADLVAYADKHNDANGDDNTDGDNNNFSWNSGEEGPSDHPDVLGRRRQARRNLLLTLFISQGVPMISGGDELGRSQAGNNNAYCQDTPRSWTAWDLDEDDQAFLGFLDRLSALRRSVRAFRYETFLSGLATDPTHASWLRPDGAEMTEADWHDRSAKAIGLLLDGVLVVLNALDVEITFTLPAARTPATHWTRHLDTAYSEAAPAPAAGAVPIAAQSAVVFVG